MTQHALQQQFEQQLSQHHLIFLYMPLMHSEHLADQALAVQLFEQASLPDNVRFAQHHQSIIQRFGRFPHRNAILGRTSTAEEQAYLTSQDAFLG